MAKRASFEEDLARLRRIAKGEATESSLGTLRKAMSGTNPLLVSTAASAAAKLGMKELLPDLVASFERFMAKPGKEDKGCTAKTALAEALETLGYEHDQPFLRGVRYFQLEPAYGGEVDTAARLRSVCAAALVRTGRREDVLFELTTLLMDREPEPRRVAAQNLGFALPSEASELLLRLKVLAGDESPEVLGDCFSSLLYLAPERSFDFVVGFLASASADVVQAASIALAQSQLRQRAVPVLVDRFQGSIGAEYKEIMLASIALARVPPAVEFLVKVIAEEHPDLAATAIRAMSGCRGDDRLQERVRSVVISRGVPMLAEEFAKSFRA